MFKITQFRTDEPLTTEQAKYIDAQIAIAARQVLVGRKIAKVRGPLGLGTQIYSYDKLTEMSAAQIDMVLGPIAKDMIDLTRNNVPIPVLHKEFEINRRDLEGSRLSGTPVDSSTAEAAAYKVAVQEDNLIFQGYKPDGTNYRIQGFYQGANNAESTSLDWGTKANIETSINNAIALLVADNIFPPYNLVLNPTQWAQAGALIANTARSYRDWIKEAIQGDIFITPALSNGNGLLMAAPNSGFCEIVVAQDLATELEMQPLSLGGNLFGRVYECLVPVLRDANAACKLSAI